MKQYKFSKNGKKKKIGFLINVTMKYKAIFFDNDGILVDTEHIVAQAAGDVLRSIGYMGNAEDLYRSQCMTKGESFLIPLQKEFSLSDDDIIRYRKMWSDSYLARLKNASISLLPSVLKTLQTLSDSFPLAVVTASHRIHFDLIHRHTGIQSYFDFILTREDFENSKPHPEPYLTAAAKMQLSPEECLVFEDSQRGVESAKNAGMTCFAIPTEFTKNMDFSSADKVLGSLDEVFLFLD
jgi:HAD superfamily hydrolase (TIGR01509 family)